MKTERIELSGITGQLSATKTEWVVQAQIDGEWIDGRTGNIEKNCRDHCDVSAKTYKTVKFRLIKRTTVDEVVG